MSLTRPSKRRGQPRWLTPVQQRAWLAYIRVQLGMNYEMHRQLQVDNGLSLSDYDILVALSNAPHARMRVADLAAQIGWERRRRLAPIAAYVRAWPDRTSALARRRSGHPRMADRLWPRSHYTSGAGPCRARAAAVLRCDSRRTSGPTDRSVGTRQRQPQSQQLAAAHSQIASRGAGGTRPTTGR